MESFEAFLRALKMYLIIGLLVGAFNGIVGTTPSTDTRLARATMVAGNVMWDVVSWPRLLVEAIRAADARLAAMPHEPQPLLYSLLRGQRAAGQVGP